MNKRVIKIYISSPSDVDEERRIAKQQIEFLRIDPEADDINSQFDFEVMMWESAPPLIGSKPQATSNEFTGRPDAADIFLCFFGRRFGSETAIAGTQYRSGTEFEFLVAERQSKHSHDGKPVILLYRLTRETKETDIEQNKNVDAFFSQIRRRHDFGGIIKTCDSSKAFSDSLFNDLRAIIRKRFVLEIKDGRSLISNRVRSVWVRGALEEVTGRVAHRFDLAFTKKDGTYGEGVVALREHFREVGNQLVILGKEGTGKSVIMLELVRMLLDEVDEDINERPLKIPVVFNLSSWSAERRPIAEWLVSQLVTVYQIPDSEAKSLISSKALCLCFDGLDEITVGGNDPHRHKTVEQQKYQTECLTALNIYLKNKGLSVILCCREQEYFALSNKFQGDGREAVSHVLLNPLSDEQVNAFMETDGQLTSLRGALALELTAKANPNSAENSTKEQSQDKYTVLHEMCRVPFLLTTMAVAYRDNANISPQQIFQVGLREESSTTQQVLERYRYHLLRKYVDVRFGEHSAIRKRRQQYRNANSLVERLVSKCIFRRSNHSDSSSKQANATNSSMSSIFTGILGHSELVSVQDTVEKYLGVLAREMEKTGQSTQLLVEQMQPDWLPSRQLHQKYLATVALLLFVFVVLITGPPLGISLGLERAYASGSVWEGVHHGTVCFGVTSLLIGAVVALGYIFIKNWHFGSALGLALGVARGTVTSLSSLGDRGIKLGLRNGIITALAAALVMGTLYRLRGYTRDHIQPLENRQWNWQQASFGIIAALVIGTVFGVFFDAWRGVAFGLALAPIIIALFGNLGTGFEVKVYPNQGIWQSLHLAIKTWAICSVFGSFSFGLSYWLFLHDWKQGILNGLLGAVCGVFSLGFGVMPVLQHASLRLLLTQSKRIPLDYVSFLDACCMLHLIRNIGGSYMFPHEELRVFFRDYSNID